MASELSSPGVPNSDSVELEPDSDSQDSVESDSGSLPDLVLLDKNPSSYYQMREGVIDASKIVAGGPAAVPFLITYTEKLSPKYSRSIGESESRHASATPISSSVS